MPLFFGSSGPAFFFPARAPAYQDRAFRLECSLRSFGDVPPVNFWFHYPVHIVDETGVLSRSPYLTGQGSIPTEEGEAEKVDRRQQLQDVYDRLSPKGDVTLRDIGAELGVLERAARNLVNKYPDDFCIQRGVVHKIQKV